MDRDDETPTGTGPTKPNVAGTTALVAQLGERLRALYAEVEAEPIRTNSSNSLAKRSLSRPSPSIPNSDAWRWTADAGGAHFFGLLGCELIKPEPEADRKRALIMAR